jgi:hypothetical protein
LKRSEALMPQRIKANLEIQRSRAVKLGQELPRCFVANQVRARQ